MNIWHILSHLGAAIAAIKDLAGRSIAFHSDPVIVAAVAANPTLKAQSDAMSADFRTIQDAFK